MAVARSSSGGLAIRYVLPVLFITSVYAHSGPYGGLPVPLQRVTSLCRLTPLLRRIGCVGPRRPWAPRK